MLQWTFNVFLRIIIYFRLCKVTVWCLCSKLSLCLCCSFDSGHPAHIRHDYFEEYIYWTDWETKSINRAHKTLGTNKTMLISTLHRPMDIHIYHPYRQPEGQDTLLHTPLSKTLFTYWAKLRWSCFMPWRYLSWNGWSFRCNVALSCLPL